MQDSETHIIHIYDFNEKVASDQKQLKGYISEALKPYMESVPEIKIRGRTNRYWAYISVNSQQAEKLDSLKKITVGGSDANIGRYYHDHQIFINKLDKSATVDQVKQYFSKYGKIIDVVVTLPQGKHDNRFQHCYIQVENEQIANKILLDKKSHCIGKDEVRLVRTFKLDEDKDSDRKLFLRIEGNIHMPEIFEQKAIKFFSTYGILRQRPKLQIITTNTMKFKMLVVYTNNKDASTALKQFENSNFHKEQKEVGLAMKLNYFFLKQNRVFVKGLKETTENAVQQAFEVFGPVADVILTKNRVSPGMSAIVGFKTEHGYKNSLAYHLDEKKISHLFMGKPYVNVFLGPQDKKSYYSLKNNSKNQPKYPHNQMMHPYGPMGSLPIPPMGMQGPPPQWGMKGPNPQSMVPPPYMVQQGAPRNYPPK